MAVLRILGYSPAVMYLRDKLLGGRTIPAHWHSEFLQSRDSSVSALVCSNTHLLCPPRELGMRIGEVIDSSSAFGVAACVLNCRMCGPQLRTNAHSIDLLRCQVAACLEIRAIHGTIQFDQAFASYVPNFETVVLKPIIQRPIPTLPVIQSKTTAATAA